MEGAWWTFFKWLKDSSLWLSSVPFWLFWFVITHSALELSAALFWLFVALLWSVICHSLHSFHVHLIVKLIRSAICHTLHSVCAQWVIKWTKISLACIVVLQDPMCPARQRQAKSLDIRCWILFDCQFPMLHHVFGMHELLHWPAAFGVALWPFAVEQAVFLWNHMPNECNRLAPVELFTGTKLHSCGALSRS